MTVISAEIFREWKKHVVTEELFRRLQVDEKVLLQEWLNGENIKDPIINALSTGGAQAINKILAFNPVNVSENGEDAKDDN